MLVTGMFDMFLITFLALHEHCSRSITNLETALFTTELIDLFFFLLITWLNHHIVKTGFFCKVEGGVWMKANLDLMR